MAKFQKHKNDEQYTFLLSNKYMLFFVCLFMFFCNAIKNTKVYIYNFLHDYRNLTQVFNNFPDFPTPANQLCKFTPLDGHILKNILKG